MALNGITERIYYGADGKPVETIPAYGEGVHFIDVEMKGE